ncbi:MAG: hypothetical protein IK093_04190 [Ruminiclostridium sp.]|nr:hypothetical protein [Ruminiclostridium sp.]
MIGYMPHPAEFKYDDVLRHGKPVHAINDSFAVKHPAMALGKRAKIFSPFDALKGFTEAVEAKDELYVERVELSEDECADLDKKITELQELVCNGSAARENNVTVTVTYFVPCVDENNDAYGFRGQYVETKGVLTEIDTVKKLITVDNKRLRFDDILRLEKSEVLC